MTSIGNSTRCRTAFFNADISNKPRPFFPGRSFLQHLPDKTLINCGSSDFLNLKQYRLKKISVAKTAQVLGDTLLIADIEGMFTEQKMAGKPGSTKVAPPAPTG